MPQQHKLDDIVTTLTNQIHRLQLQNKAHKIIQLVLLTLVERLQQTLQYHCRVKTDYQEH